MLFSLENSLKILCILLHLVFIFISFQYFFCSCKIVIPQKTYRLLPNFTKISLAKRHWIINLKKNN
jgi:hypothetical protein